MIWDVHWYDTLGSTNTHLREWASDAPDLASGTVVATLEQTAGRGRLSRTWESTAGRNLTFSLLMRESASQERIPSLSMAAALGVATFLESGFNLPARVKWPNDVRVKGRKICGILAELADEGEAGTRNVVVGIGVNVNMSPDAVEAIEPPATSILRETGAEYDVAECLSELLPLLDPLFAKWRQAGFEGLRDEWMQRCDFVNEAVSIQQNGSVVCDGTLRDFDSNGALILEDRTGTTRTIMAGDVSLRAV